MILDNANVITMDPALPGSRVLAIAGGKILGGVDSREDAIASHAHERIDLDGLTVLPGLVESHCHFRGWALRNLQINLAGISTIDELLSRITAHENTQSLSPPTQSNDWLLGGGWDNTLSDSNESMVDAIANVCANRPVALHSRDGHALLITERTLHELNITLDDLDVDGSIIDRDSRGEFTGVLRERAAQIVHRMIPTCGLDTRTMAKAMRLAASRGVTSLHDMDGSAALRDWRLLENERGLSVRVWVHMLIEDLPHIEALGLGAGWGSDRLSLGGLKIFADGTLSSNTASLHSPSSAQIKPNFRSGITLTGPDALKSLSRRAGAAGLPLLVHAIGDRAFSDVIDALESTREHWEHLDMRPRIEHAQLVRTQDLARASSLGIALSVQPTMLVSDRELADTQWQGKTDRAYAYKSMVDAGCGLLFGSDAPIEELNPLAAIHAATTRNGGAHGLKETKDSWHREQILDMESALLASTAWPADATGVSHRLGRLTPGKDADLVVLSDDPLTTPVAGIKIVATMVGGRWTYGAANLPTR